MKGASEFARLFKTCQAHGRLYLEVGSHARGSTFHIYVLPKTSTESKVEVYGIIKGQAGWTEEYGWLHHGPWEDDFNQLVELKKKELADKVAAAKQVEDARLQEEQARINSVLGSYERMFNS